MNRFVLEVFDEWEVLRLRPLATALSKEQLLSTFREYYESFPKVTNPSVVNMIDPRQNSRFSPLPGVMIYKSDLEQWDGIGSQRIYSFRPPVILTVDEWFARDGI